MLGKVDIWLKSHFETTKALGDISHPSQDMLQQSAQDTREHVALIFDRMAHLRPVLFDIFADNGVHPPVVDYVNLVSILMS